MATEQQKPANERARPERERKPYRAPELVEWGSITDITLGMDFNFDDFPGGSGGT